MQTKIARQHYVLWYFSKSLSFRLRNIIFIDESPFNLYIMRKHGWSRRGRAPNPIVRPRSENITLILAMNGCNIVNSEAIQGSVNTEVFETFLTATMNILGTDEEFIFVMDNVSFHHSVEVPESSNFTIFYLPPYSPMLNPCEEAFSVIKSNVRRNTQPTGIQDLISRMNDATHSVSSQNLENFIMHSESFYESCLNLEDIGRE
ncbi:hypothetical protein RF11_13650 [Thelohanellus kitauei]|uniref:Tc1-like transposase DDE domain-containing protein n=1 Tax=Thelohanellus kitauei TaxID=669202 RepID=A0A0C2N1V9_THEKT|nr:hypothetical protein RF11_13650 [Thelohanellus kitauei]